MDSTKVVLDCFHGQELSFKHAQYECITRGRASATTWIDSFSIFYKSSFLNVIILVLKIKTHLIHEVTKKKGGPLCRLAVCFCP